MKKRIKGPMWKKGQMLLPDVYHPPQELEANLTEEQKKWPLTDLLIGPAGAEVKPPVVQERDPNPRPAPLVEPANEPQQPPPAA